MTMIEVCTGEVGQVASRIIESRCFALAVYVVFMSPRLQSRLADDWPAWFAMVCYTLLVKCSALSSYSLICHHGL